MALTAAEQQYFDETVAKIKYSVNVCVPIEAMDHDTLTGKHKEALGICWADADENGKLVPFRITIDEYFIHECFIAIEKPYMKIEPETLEQVIAHEIAHIAYWRHGKKHTEHTRYICGLIESGLPHGLDAPDTTKKSEEKATMFDYKPFLPETPIEGHIGFYPVTNEEWRALPLPLKCATWYRNDIESVIFDAWFDNYSIRAEVEVHPENVFKALFTLSGGGVQLYSIVGVRTTDGKRIGAKWFQDTTSGAFGICFNGGGVIAKQGGYQAHMPENCYKDENEKWMLIAPTDNDQITRYCLV